MYYYLPGSSPTDSERLVPVPQISLEPEILYANDSVVGYNYILTLTGYITSLDLTKPMPDKPVGFFETMTQMKKIRDVFKLNGGELLITSSEGDVLKATGGNLESLEFEQTDNNWVNYARYTTKIIFNEVFLGDCSGINIPGCSTLPELVDKSKSPNLIEMQKYKVKSFTDGWSIDVSDNAYNSFGNFRNEHIPITYNINSTGKHYFVSDKLLPAWEQAKNFCQDRLHTQVSRLITNILKTSPGSDSCSATDSLASLFDSGPPGLLSGLSDSSYEIYNEVIECESSESDGTFSVSYSALLKKKLEGDTYSDPKSIHTYTVDKNRQRSSGSDNTSMTINGNIQGLIEGGLINNNDILEFPDNGVIIRSSNNPTETKYKNALASYNKIMQGKELKNGFVSSLGITYQSLNVNCSSTSPTSAPPCKTHSATHNYAEGTISYTAEYDDQISCVPNGVSYNDITINIEDPLPVIAEFIVPGRSGGPIVQKFIAETSRKISLSINGSVVPSQCIYDLDTLTDNICVSGLGLPAGIPSAQIANLKLVSDDSNLNYLDGSFTISRSYICCDSIS